MSGQAGKWAHVAVALALMVALCGASSCDEAGSTQASTTATPSASPTPSKPTVPQDSAVLGGSVAAFDKKFGANNCCYRNGWDYQGPYGLMWTGVDTGHSVATNVDEGSSDRVTAVDNGGNSDSRLSVTVDQAKALCDSFLPSDAVYRTTTAIIQFNFPAGMLLTYTSALLANTLPADDFVDRSGKATTPGTFYVYYDYGSGTSSVDYCTLATDPSLIVLLPKS